MVGRDAAYFWARGIRPLNGQVFLQGGSASNTPVWNLILGGVPLYWEDPGQVPSQGGPLAGKGAAKEVHDKQVELSISGCGNEGSGAIGGGEAHPPTPEYRRPVYRHSADTGAKSGGGATSRGAGVDEMVGAAQTRLGLGRDRDVYVY